MASPKHRHLRRPRQGLFRRRFHLISLRYPPPKDRYLQFVVQTNPFSLTLPLLPTTAYDDGRTQLLLCVHGLLPITYRQASYHIPIAIWITRQYPRKPPLAFVVPTSEMLVRPSKYIDVSGLCKIDYILNWEKKYEVRLGDIAPI
jgi:ESCRT-I complex subunit TSG101